MKRIQNYLIVPIFLIIISAAGYYLLLHYGTIGSKSIENLGRLLITDSDLPDGWEFEYEMPIYGDFNLGDENINIAFSKKPELGFAHQYVYRFKNILITKKSFGFLQKHLLLDEENHGIFTNYESQYADKQDLACEVSEEGHVICDYLARYDNFIVYFGISAKYNQLTQEQFGQIISSIESRVINELD